MRKGEHPLRVAVIIGSTREGRAGAEVAEWFLGRLGERPDFAPAVVDLADFSFPARLPGVPTREMTDFTRRIDAAEAFVVVTPEYNRGYPASLKQAIDLAYDEWHAKPVGFVSYGCRSAGLFAVEQLRVVFTELHTVTVRDTVSFNLLDQRSDAVMASVTSMLDQLRWWGRALRDARAAIPYVS
ncbi:NAD(P)H-dependent FMN reductase [Prauserella shujinwangii]|uniref:NAD(P)H-dependent FMN reductase n=1 Tax=Prauserella shujinwangii TaxID=1453103 RepID=A0A2T0LQ64_9PSEU|nr:NAD(P)H-dependent oxidoreductase [Prauserella shujinwangii]PRX45402.1 NAD(P)H-dependent FMN reductase [Prauserella shujinwangii]